MNFADEALAAELRLPVRRWGGNATTRYNWQTDTSNHASDWYFENIPNDNAEPGGAARRLEQRPVRRAEPPHRHGDAADRAADRLDAERRAPTACGFSVAQVRRAAIDRSVAPDCGNGVRDERHRRSPATIRSTPASRSRPTFVQAWMQHLIGRYGTAGAGGVRFYNLDNEPMLWADTHRDVHPQPTELRRDARPHATRTRRRSRRPIRRRRRSGPAEWGWTGYFWSALDWAPGGAWWNNPQDRLAHGNVPFVEWYLQQMRAYEQQHGVRILDYLDLHYYPQAAGVSLSPAGSAATQALRLRSTRSLWDPTLRRRELDRRAGAARSRACATG